MMKRQNKKRGFTIVELTIVVAVIAILSAVLIPTFSGIIKKSRESADQQAARQMNTVLASAVLDEDADINDVFAVLDEADINAENYQALYKNRFFFYDKELKIVVYAEKTASGYEALYPAEAVGVANPENWVTLSGEIGKVDIGDIDIDKDAGKATVDSAEELASVMSAIREGDKATKTVKEIVLSNTTYNLMGADISIPSVKNNADNEVDLTINGNGATLDGFVNGTPVRENQKRTNASTRNYSAGLIGTVAKGANVTISNITIDGAVFGDKNVSLVGLVGTVSGKVTFDNVVVKDTTFVGQQKVGAFAGYLNNDNAEVIVNDNCKMENVTVVATQGMAGGVFGLLEDGKVTVKSFTNINVNVKLEKVSSGHYINYARTEEGLLDTTIALDMNNDFSLCLEEKTAGAVTGYRYFATCAKYGFIHSGVKVTDTGLTGYGNKPAVFAYGATAVALPTLTENVGYVWTNGI